MTVYQIAHAAMRGPHEVREAGREPIERDTLYHKVDRTAEGFSLGEKITAGV